MRTWKPQYEVDILGSAEKSGVPCIKMWVHRMEFWGCKLRRVWVRRMIIWSAQSEGLGTPGCVWGDGIRVNATRMEH